MLERGCVHVIGLEPLRDEAGARWEKIRASVHTKLEAILRQKLGPSDFFAPLNDVSYLVTMPSASRDDAQVSCLRVTHDLYTNYLGQFDPARISFYAAAQGDEDTLVLESLSKERINLLVEKAGIDERKEPSRDERDAGLAAAPRKDETALDVRPQFWPIWDARNEAVTSYLCLPETIAFAHAPLEPVALQDLKPKERAYVDLCCLRSGVAALAKHLERGERFLMTLRVPHGFCQCLPRVTLGLSAISRVRARGRSRRSAAKPSRRSCDRAQTVC